MFLSSLFNLLITASLAGIERRDFFLSSSFLITANNMSTQNTPSNDEVMANGNSIYNEDYRNTAMDDSSKWKVTLPLERCTGGTNCIRITVPGQPKQIGKRIIRPKRVYKVIVDTGSSYLVIPQYKNEDSTSSFYFNTILEDVTPQTENKNPLTTLLDGNYLGYIFNNILISVPRDEDVPFELDKSMYSPTEDIYGSQLGFIEWKESSVILRDDRLVPLYHPAVVLGLLDEALTKESGGALLGLVKNSNTLSEKVSLRPTFFQQIGIRPLFAQTDERRDITSFQIDSPNKQLTLLASKDTSLIPEDANNIIDLINLQPLGDFIEHYAFVVDELVLNHGEHVVTTTSLSNKNQTPRPIVAVFDTGLTGCLFTKPLWIALTEEIGIQSYDEVFSVEVSKPGNESRHGISIQSDASKNPFYYLSSIELDWFDDEDNAPYVVVLGQTFLCQGILTIDIDNRCATFS